MREEEKNENISSKYALRQIITFKAIVCNEKYFKKS